MHWIYWIYIYWMYCQNHGIWKRRTQFHTVTYFVTLTKLLAFWVSLLYKMGSATTWFSRGCFESNISTDKVLYKAWYEPYSLISIHKWLSKRFSARWSRFHQSHQRASTEIHNLGSLFTTWESQDTSIFKEMHEMLELREEREKKKKWKGFQELMWYTRERTWTLVSPKPGFEFQHLWPSESHLTSLCTFSIL